MRWTKQDAKNEIPVNVNIVLIFPILFILQDNPPCDHWNVMSCSLVDKYKHFEVACPLYLQG